MRSHELTWRHISGVRRDEGLRWENSWFTVAARIPGPPDLLLEPRYCRCCWCWWRNAESQSDCWLRDGRAVRLLFVDDDREETVGSRTLPTTAAVKSARNREKWLLRKLKLGVVRLFFVLTRPADSPSSPQLPILPSTNENNLRSSDLVEESQTGLNEIVWGRRNVSKYVSVSRAILSNSYKSTRENGVK